MQVTLTLLSLIFNVIVLILLTRHQKSAQNLAHLEQQLLSIEKGQERLEKSLREEMQNQRRETSTSAREAREELHHSFAELKQEFFSVQRELFYQQKNQLDSYAKELNNSLSSSNQNITTTIGEMSNQQKHLLDNFSNQLKDLTQMNERKLDKVRATVEEKLLFLQEDNNKKLEQMRLTVDEKLHATLEHRLGESFKLVSERLEKVHQGLGEMQSLASGVGDLKKVLTNVKTRGTLGEIQLESVLEQIMNIEQYEKNVSTKVKSNDRVEFAIKLPTKDDSQTMILLPIDSKFPLEDYQRLLGAQETADIPGCNEALKNLENRIKLEAKTIRDKYIDPPYTTDFAIMFLPIEGLFAEVLRIPGLWDFVQREYKVAITGPTTLAAFLNSLQMGFRTLAIQKRSSEVEKLLGAVKTEFGKFSNILEKTQKKLQEASNTIDTASKKTRTIEKHLRKVEKLPLVEVKELLPEMDDPEFIDEK